MSEDLFAELIASVKEGGVILAASTNLHAHFIQILTCLPWGSILAEVLRQLLNLFYRSITQGLYKILGYESALELKAPQGHLTRFTKRQKGCYLQDNIIAYPDQAWGGWPIPARLSLHPGE